MITESDAVFRFGRSHEDAPAILGHLDVVEVGPAARFDRDSGSQVDVVGLEPRRPHVIPPLHVEGQPVLKSSLESFVSGEIDVVGNFSVLINVTHRVLLSPLSNPIPREVWSFRSSVQSQGSIRSSGVGSDENPVLPGTETPEYLALQVFGPGETEVCFHSGQ